MSVESDRLAEEFLAIADMFKLGRLPTEQQHPSTMNLADLSRNDLPEALRVLKAIDVGVLETAVSKTKDMYRLKDAIRDTLETGNKVFLYGCGATGRLSLSLEYLWRHVQQGGPMADQVRGFMTGGDVALIYSREGYEDKPEIAAQHLHDMGFQKDDLVVAITEGGETPSVIGVVEEAARKSARKPFFLYCNPTNVLAVHVERSNRVINNPAIDKIQLFTGNMALSGSTRLQATTIQQEIAGAALMGWRSVDLMHMRDLVARTDYGFLEAFIEKEAEIYKHGGFVTYETNNYGITLLTDTTERAPTFSLIGFENQQNPDRVPSWSYLCMPDTETPDAALESILLRKPRVIDGEVKDTSTLEHHVLGFDFSRAARDQRQALTNGKAETFAINREGDTMTFRLAGLRHDIDVAHLDLLTEHLLLKSMMNMHSTLVMGRMGRFESNVMIYVKPSNNKLIDRSIRYVEYLQRSQGRRPDPYDVICRRLFEERERLQPGEPIVLKTLENLKARPPG